MRRPIVSTIKVAKRLGFLATGSEITTGEIVNSNSKVMAERLQDHGVHVGEHLSCDDNCKNIEESLNFMLSRHDAIIVTGGLGPTSDDCTREVIAKAADQKLVFNQSIWDSIVERLAKRNFSAPENNKQQAYFPAKAKILVNENGTATGCYLYVGKVLVFMLPGPPHECVPMFQNQVLPILLKEDFATSKRLFRWRLMNVSESKIAELLDPIAKKHQLDFAYRAHYPFTDIKLFLDPQTKAHTRILLEVKALVRPNFVTHLNQTLSKQLQEHIEHHPLKIYLDDQVTKGAFKQALLSPVTEHCFVGKNVKADLEIYLSGLEAYWQAENETNALMNFKLALRHGGKHEQFEGTALNRGRETLDYVIEFSSWKILHFI
jgi:molybdenum cofactor synthesis domain-containing protein